MDMQGLVARLPVEKRLPSVDPEEPQQRGWRTGTAREVGASIEEPTAHHPIFQCHHRLVVIQTSDEKNSEDQYTKYTLQQTTC